MALGLLLGLVLGLLLIFVVEHIDDTYPDLGAIEQDLRLPLLGLVPFYGKTGGPLLLGHGAPRSLVEALRSLRSNVQFAAAEPPLTSLLLTSSMPSEGKTTLATDLAMAAAEAGERVVLVDADLRRPGVSKLVGLDSGVTGLSNILIGQVNVDTVLQTHASEDGSFSIQIIPAGPLPPNPPALFESEAWPRLLGTLKSRADLVIVDAPPVGHFSDAQILASQVSGVLLVVDSRAVRRGVVRGARRLLDIASARIIGLVANKVRQTGLGGYYYYGSRYYYYYRRYYHKYYGDDEGNATSENGKPSA
jgi:capsular exopolysaccharide synthesis family protein